DLGEGLGVVRPGRPLRDLRDRLELDAQRVTQARGIVTLDTGDGGVLGMLPGVDVGPHDVTRVAELRARAHVPEAGAGGAADRHHERDDEQNDGAPAEAARPRHLWHLSHSSIGNTTAPPIVVLPSW